MLPIEWKFIEPKSLLTEKRPIFINGRQLMTSQVIPKNATSYGGQRIVGFSVNYDRRGKKNQPKWAVTVELWLVDDYNHGPTLRIIFPNFENQYLE